MKPDWSKAPEWATDYVGYWIDGSGTRIGRRELLVFQEARPADPYAELKKAAADPTKQIRLLDVAGKGTHGEWEDCGPCSYRARDVFLCPPEDYQIRDKPKVKTAYRRLWRGDSGYMYYMIRIAERELTDPFSSGTWIGPVEPFTYEEPSL